MPRPIATPDPAFIIGQEHVRLSVRRPVRVERLRVTEPVAPHGHAFYELCIVMDGAATHRAREASHRVGPRDAVIVAPGQVHAFDEIESLVVVNVYYLTEWLVADLPAMWDQPWLVPLFLAVPLFPRLVPGAIVTANLDEATFTRVAAGLGELEAEWERGTPSHLYLRATLLKLMVDLGRAVERTGAAAASPAWPPEVRALVDVAERAVADGGSFQLSAAAAEIGISESHLSRRFRAALGVPPARYFQRRRVHQAAHLLLDRAVSITDVAHRLGYADGAHLCRVFRAAYGRSPRDFRSLFTQP